MLKDLKLFQKIQTAEEKCKIDFLDRDKAEKIAGYHRSFPQYEETPCIQLKNLAKYLGVKDIFIKDESYRFKLNAFKVLGGSYAIGKYISQSLGRDMGQLSYQELVSDRLRKELGDLTFITATDGNHGRGVAMTARLLKQKCVVYMPHGSSEERVRNIEKEGARVVVHNCNYDDAVRQANEDADKNGWVLVQDTSWEGYQDIPGWIMQGYMTMAYEAYQTMESLATRPSHIFLQAGVGSFAAAITGFFANIYPGKEKPIITIIEANAADCIYRSAKASQRVCVPGSLDTIMAGLACGEPNMAALEILMDYGENFISAPDYFAAHGMRVLASPLKDDIKIVSGESGAAPLGVVAKILKEGQLEDMKRKLQLDEDSVVLFFSTEGDTDRKNYREIVWDGKCSSIIS